MWGRWTSKRCLDLFASAASLLLLSPLFLVVALLIKADSRGPVFFRQQRVGIGRKPFYIFKFRTMVEGADLGGRELTAPEDPRITRIGRALRRTKIDELPQLINVFRGEMSLVGPRPEVSRYVDLFQNDYEQILRVRPGITDLASLKYYDESAVLAHSEDVELAYVTRLLPDKIALAKEYVARSSLWLDISIIIRTVFRIFVGPRFSDHQHS